MSIVKIELPDSILAEARKLAEKDQISLDHFVEIAITERVSTLRGLNYLRERAGRGDAAKLKEVLQRAPNVEPNRNDRINP